MPRVQRVTRQRKPRPTSFGLFIAAVLYAAGYTVWGANPWLILGVCVLSFLLDQLFTGSTTREDVYIN